MNRLHALILAWSITLVCPSYSVRAEVQTVAPIPDPLANDRRIDAELRKLDETPFGRKVKEVEEKFRSAHDQYNKETKSLEEQFSKLGSSPEYRAFDDKRRALEAQRLSAWSVERKVMKDAARVIYESRHAELQKLSLTQIPAGRRLGLDVLTYPRVDGSTSTQPLSVIIACRILENPYEWVYPEPTGSPWRSRPEIPRDLLFQNPNQRNFDFEFNLSAARVLAKPPKPGEDRVAIMINSLLAAGTSTHDAYVNVITGRCDLNLAARLPSADETKLAQAKGVKLVVRPIARDALVFIVNHKNPVTNILSQQLPLIYSGKLTSWRGLGGAEEQIIPLWRERNSGSRELFDSLVTPNHPLPEPARQFSVDLFLSSMSGPYNRVTQEPNALGYSVFYYEHYMALSPYTRAVAIDGVEPSSVTITSGKYPYRAEVYAVYRDGQPAGTPTAKLVEWLLSPEGQAVIRESGYVPVK